MREYGPIITLPEDERGVDCEDCGAVIFPGVPIREAFEQGWQLRHFSHVECVEACNDPEDYIIRPDPKLGAS